MSKGMTNKTGYTGIHWCNYHNRWRVEIYHKGKRYRLGRFRSKVAAAHAYAFAALRFHGGKEMTDEVLNLIRDNQPKEEKQRLAAIRRSKRYGYHRDMLELWNAAIAGDVQAASSLQAGYHFKLFAWLTNVWNFQSYEAEKLIAETWNIALDSPPVKSADYWVYRIAWTLVAPLRKRTRKIRNQLAWPIFQLLIALPEARRPARKLA